MLDLIREPVALGAVPSGEGVGHCVEFPRAELDGEIKSKKLTAPVMLWNSRQPLVQHELHCIVICSHHKLSAPEIRPPMANNLHKSDELMFICRDLKVP